jgi:anti-anti-sigma factor
LLRAKRPDRQRRLDTDGVGLYLSAPRIASGVTAAAEPRRPINGHHDSGKNRGRDHPCDLQRPARFHRCGVGRPAFQVGDKRAVIVDLSDVDYVASLANRFLLSGAKAVKGNGGKLVILSPEEYVYEVLKIAGIDQIMPILFDRSEAIAAVRPSPA